MEHNLSKNFLKFSSILQTFIHYSYDTKSGRASRPMIPFSNKFGWNAYLAYNPLEQRLYAWDNGNQVTYEVTLSDETSS